MFKLTAEKYNTTGVVALLCDVCGREIIGKPHHVIIEGAKLTTCAECARLGSSEWKPEPRSLSLPKRAEPPTRIRSRKLSRIRDLREDLTITENFGTIVREARQRLNISQEDLGRKIGEKVSVIRKVEGEKIMPNERLARKLERALGIRLIVPLVEPKVPASSRTSRGVTLGEIAYLKNSRRRQLQNEGDNS
jgi:putative transcription factor